MTDLERIIAACEIAERAVKRRRTQAFTAEEEPIVLQGLASVPNLLLSLLSADSDNATSGDNNSTGTLG